MGLDIRAVSGLKLIKAYDIAKDIDDFYELAYGRFRRIFLKEEPGFNRGDGLVDGVYDYVDNFNFRAGSYGGYSNWRNQLSLLALSVPAKAVWDDPKKFAGQPLVELIDFSDCEGFIGPRTSAKLALDFRSLWVSIASRVNNILRTDGEGKYFMARYDDWTQAFELAADNGAVHFG